MSLMSEGVPDFIELTKIPEYNVSTGAPPMAVTFSYPYLIAANSGDQVSIFNVRAKTIIILRRKMPSPGSTVLDIAINSDSSYVAIGGLTENGGEIVVWSATTKQEIASIRTPEGVSQIQFVGTTDIAYSDIQGKIAIVSIVNFLIKFQLRPKAKFERDLGCPILCMNIHNGQLFVGAQCGTFTLDVTREGLPSTKIDENQSLCFSFINNLMLRGVGHDVIITNLETNSTEVVHFSQTPAQIATKNGRTILVLFKGGVEMATVKHRCEKKVPKGLSVQQNGDVYIVSDALYHVKIVSEGQRIEYYMNNDNWDMVFNELGSPDDVDDLNMVLNRYIDSSSFDPEVLFDVLERLHMTDFVVLGMTKNKRKEILEAFVDSDRNKWCLNIEFITEIIRTLNDKEKVWKFLDRIEMNLLWIRAVVKICLDNNYLDITKDIADKYRKDFYILYLICYFENDAKSIHDTAGALICDISNKELFTDTLKFFENHDLSMFVEFNEVRAQALFEVILGHIASNGIPGKALANRIIQAIDKESPIWELIGSFIFNNKITIDQESQPYVENFLFHRTAPALETQQQLLLMMLATNQVRDLNKYLTLSRARNFMECEYEIICYMHSVPELENFLIRNKIQSFADKLRAVVADQSQFVQYLRSESRIFMSMNADEYCREIVALKDVNIIHEIGDSFSDDSTIQWHFYKRIFVIPELAKVATYDEIIQYTTYLAKFRPDDMLKSLKIFKDIPALKVLSICQSRCIIDATLYVCDLMKDFERVKSFSIEMLTSSLMTDQDPRVVTQICQYLSITSCPEEERDDLWFSIMHAFQMPIFALRESEDKVVKIAELLGTYMDAMLNEMDSARQVIQYFTKLFCFLPMKVAKPILSRFFHSARVKYQFSGTLVQIMKEEAINNQLDRIKKLGSGKEYDGIRCPACSKLLGRCSSVAAPCGHVFHSECAKNGWCPSCQSTFNGVVPGAAPESPARFHADPVRKIKRKPQIGEFQAPKLGQVTRLEK